MADAYELQLTSEEINQSERRSNTYEKINLSEPRSITSKENNKSERRSNTYEKINLSEPRSITSKENNKSEPRSIISEEINLSEPRSNTLVDTRCIRVVIALSLIVVGVLAVTGIVLHFTTAGCGDCNGYGDCNRSICNTVSDNRQVPVAVYTRWGRTVCPNNTKTMYNGYAAGSHKTHPGGMVDTLCLPKEPQFSKYLAGVQLQSLIYGAEYEGTETYFEALFDKSITNQNVPCAVCEAAGRVNQIMLPARTECFDGWEFEYTGYMMAERYDHHRSQVKCVDKDPEILDGERTNDDGNLFYFIEPAGQLPDPPYNVGKELTCVICTK